MDGKALNTELGACVEGEDDEQMEGKLDGIVEEGVNVGKSDEA